MTRTLATPHIRVAAQPGKHVSMIVDRWQRNKFKGLTDREECNDRESCAFSASWGHCGAARGLRDGWTYWPGQRRDHGRAQLGSAHAARLRGAARGARQVSSVRLGARHR